MLIKNQDELIDNGTTPYFKKAREDLIKIFNEIIKSVNPKNSVEKVVDCEKISINDEEYYFKNYENIFLVAFGKASIGMSQAIIDNAAIKEGVIITNEDINDKQHDNIQFFKGGHPIPNQNSIKGAEKAIEIIEKCNENDLLIVLISGGGSALLCKPRIELSEMKETTDLLLRSGADIKEINTIRKHLSYVKGGQLIKHVKFQVISLIISDIIDDPIEFIASGPTYPDSTTFSDAKNILEKYEIWHEIPDSARNIIKSGMNKEISETLKPDNKIFDKIKNKIVANNKIACSSAINYAKKKGYNTILLTTRIDGEARDIGKYLADKTKNSEAFGKTMFISAGETTVTIKGNGKGGRNQELTLNTIEPLRDTKILFSSFATDGVDGNSDAAGAIIDGESYNKSKKLGLDYKLYLEDNNSYEFFKNLNDLIFTGPTGTNVMDIQIIIKIN